MLLKIPLRKIKRFFLITKNAGCGVAIPRSKTQSKNTNYKYQHYFYYNEDTSDDPEPIGGTRGYLVVNQKK